MAVGPPAGRRILTAESSGAGSAGGRYDPRSWQPCLRTSTGQAPPAAKLRSALWGHSLRGILPLSVSVPLAQGEGDAVRYWCRVAAPASAASSASCTCPAASAELGFRAHGHRGRTRDASSVCTHPLLSFVVREYRLVFGKHIGAIFVLLWCYFRT